MLWSRLDAWVKQRVIEGTRLAPDGPFIIPFFRNELSGKWAYVRDFRLNPSNFEMDLEEVWLTADAPRKKA